MDSVGSPGLLCATHVHLGGPNWFIICSWIWLTDLAISEFEYASADQTAFKDSLADSTKTVATSSVILQETGVAEHFPHVNFIAQLYQEGTWAYPHGSTSCNY